MLLTNKVCFEMRCTCTSYVPPATPSAAPPQTAAPSLEEVLKGSELIATTVYDPKARTVTHIREDAKLPAPDAQGGDEAARNADWFIEKVNADNDDIIKIARDNACLVREHIEDLRRQASRQTRENGGFTLEQVKAALATLPVEQRIAVKAYLLSLLPPPQEDGKA
jgi:hypothetical protein